MYTRSSASLCLGRVRHVFVSVLGFSRHLRSELAAGNRLAHCGLDSIKDRVGATLEESGKRVAANGGWID